MPEFFIPKQVPRRWAVGLWAVAFTAATGGLVCLYGETGAGASFGIAAVCVAVLLSGIMVYEFASNFVVSPMGRAILVFVAIVLDIGITWGISALSDWYAPEKFPRLIPLLVLSAGANWASLRLLLRPSFTEEPESAGPPAVDPLIIPEKRDTIDRISVKKGSEIHIVKADELLYMLAEGDYVMLYTSEGRFLKEQTMRWFEEHLPDHFVRIHRSCIVNIDEIARVELFGKENYRVRLKNGAVLKASINGYRALKIRLGL